MKNNELAMKKLKKAYVPIRKETIFFMVMTAASFVFWAATQVFAAFFLESVLNSVIYGTPIENFSLGAVSIICQMICHFGTLFFRWRVESRSERGVRRINFVNAIDNYLFMVNAETGDVYSRLTAESGNYSTFNYGMKIRAISSLLNYVVLSAIMIYFSFISFLSIVLLSCLSYLIVKALSQKQQQALEKANIIIAKISQYTLKGLENIDELASLKKQDYYAKGREELLEQRIKIFKEYFNYQTLSNSINSIMGSILPLVAVLVGTLHFASTNSSLGAVMSIYFIATYLSVAFEEIVMTPQYFAQSNASRKRFLEFFDKEETGTEEIENSSQIKIKINGFSYEEDEQKVLLKDLNLEVNQGDMLVINGKSGCGKSTLFKLLTKQLKLTKEQGEICIDGKNINDIKLSSLFENLLVVNQLPFVFSGELKESLCLGDEFTAEEIDEILKVCCLEDFMAEYGKNYAIELSGKNISSGQQQRISIARSLLRKPKILLLDEPTSALDSETAQNFVTNLTNFAKKIQMTVLMITHKESETESLGMRQITL